MEPLTTAGSVDFDDDFMDAEDAVLVEGQLGVNEVTEGSSLQQQQVSLSAETSTAEVEQPSRSIVEQKGKGHRTNTRRY